MSTLINKVLQLRLIIILLFIVLVVKKKGEGDLKSEAGGGGISCKQKVGAYLTGGLCRVFMVYLALGSSRLAIRN